MRLPLARFFLGAVCAVAIGVATGCGGGSSGGGAAGGGGSESRAFELALHDRPEPAGREWVEKVLASGAEARALAEKGEARRLP